MKQKQVFRAPTAYEEEMLKAQRQRQLAEMLQQQAFAPEAEPYTFQGFRAQPSAANAIARVLSAYTAKKVGEKAETAESAARQADLEAFQALRRDLGPQTRSVTGGALPETDVTGIASAYQPEMAQQPMMETVMPTYQQRQARLDQAFASGSPMARQYAQLLMSREPTVGLDALMEATDESRAEYQRTGDPSVLKKPSKSAEIKPPVFTGGKYYDTATQSWQDIPGYVEQQQRISAASRAPEPLMLVDVGGKPTYTPRSQAVGQQAFVNKPAAQLTGDDKTDRRQYRQKRQSLQDAMNSLTTFADKLRNIPREESITGEKAGELSSAYKLALGAVRELQNTGVLNPGELPFIEDTLRDPQSLKQLINPQSRNTITGQINTIADLLEGRARTNDKVYGYDVTPLETPEWFRKKPTRSKY